MTSCPGPRISRRQMIQVGAASYLGLDLPMLLKAENTRQAGRQRGRVHHHLPQRRADPPRHVGSRSRMRRRRFAGEFKPIPTSVPGVLFGEHLPKFAPADAPLHAHPLGAPQRQQRPRGGGVLCPHRPRPRRDRRRGAAGRLPRDRLGRRHAATTRWRGGCRTCCCRTSRRKAPAARRSRGSSAAGSASRATRSSSSATRTPPTSRCPNSLSARTSTPPGSTCGSSLARQLDPPARDSAIRRRRRHPREGLRPAHLPGDARGRADRPRAGEGPRRLRPEHLRAERAAVAPADRGRYARGVRVVGTGRERHLGHARQQLHQAQEGTAAATRRGVLGAARRPRRPRDAGADAGGRAGRLRPHAEDQRQRRRPRPLELLLLAGAGRRRHEGRLRPRRERRDRREAERATR